LRKSPGFTIAAVLTLTMAIGANAIVFSVLNGLILRPLHVPQPESLYLIERASDKGTSQSYPDYVDLRDRNHSFDGLAAYSVTQVAMDTGEGPALIWGMGSSSNYFDALRIQPYLGRFFNPSDDHGPSSAPYIVLSTGGDRCVASQDESRSSSPALAVSLRIAYNTRRQWCGLPSGRSSLAHLAI
jgi:hypothetical protein